MNHFSEHILELYVRSSPDVAGQQAAIEQHCAECFSCREMVREMKEFYHAAEATTKLLDAAGAESNALVMEAQIRNRPIPQAYVSQSLSVRMVRFVRRRPVTSSFFGAAVLFFGYLSFSAVVHSSKGTPVYHQFNAQDNSVEIFDRSNKKIWDLRLNADVIDMKNLEGSYFALKVMEFDLDHDGVNEVVVIPPVMNDADLRGRAKVFTSAGEKAGILSIPFRDIRFGTLRYNSDFYPSVMVTDREKKNLFVSYTNGRSPTVIARYGNDGTLLGTYWHYGQLNSMVFRDPDHDGKMELILSGINDTEDQIKRPYAVTIILEPDQITGNTECSASRGFGLPRSGSEQRIIRYPNPEIIENAPENLIAKTSAFPDEKDLRVLTDAELKNSRIALEYFFDSTLTVRDVKFDAQTLFYYSTLFNQGKLRQPVNDEYTQALVRSVLYWEGNEWKIDPLKNKGQV
ncbi:MAG: hypothetical protein ACOYNS_04785, partial [Bacteroidota bacterium]